MSSHTNKMVPSLVTRTTDPVRNMNDANMLVIMLTAATKHAKG